MLVGLRVWLHIYTFLCNISFLFHFFHFYFSIFFSLICLLITQYNLLNGISYNVCLPVGSSLWHKPKFLCSTTLWRGRRLAHCAFALFILLCGWQMLMCVALFVARNNFLCVVRIFHNLLQLILGQNIRALLVCVIRNSLLRY